MGSTARRGRVEPTDDWEQLALDSYQRLVGEWTEICCLNMFRSRSGLRRAGGLVTARGV